MTSENTSKSEGKEIVQIIFYSLCKLLINEFMFFSPAKKLIKLLLKTEPDDRMTIEQLIQYSWIRVSF